MRRVIHTIFNIILTLFTMDTTNVILDNFIKSRNGHYVHAIEVSTAYEIECVIDTLYSEFVRTYTVAQIKQFFNTMSVIYWAGDEPENEADENEVNDFNIDAYINTLI